MKALPPPEEEMVDEKFEAPIIETNPYILLTKESTRLFFYKKVSYFSSTRDFQ